MNERRSALGKGLSALIPDVPVPARGGPLSVDLDQLSPGAQQPRHQMDDVKLDELARSIKANGVVQPILVRPDGNAYRIIAGERRWRAAQRAGLRRVPVVVRENPDDTEESLLELALIENIQREDLNPLDQARGYQRLTEEFGLTQEQIAAAVGKDRSSVANYIRLLRLPSDVQAHLADGTLSMGHARALAGLSEPGQQRQAAKEIVARGLSVRGAEALVKRLTSPPLVRPPQVPDVHTRAAEERLRFALGTHVRIRRRGKGGTIEIAFGSEAELDRVYQALTSTR